MNTKPIDWKKLELELGAKLGATQRLVLQAMLKGDEVIHSLRVGKTLMRRAFNILSKEAK